MSHERVTLFAADVAQPAVLDAATGRWWTVGALRDGAAAVDADITAAIGVRRALIFLRCNNDLPTLLGYLAAIEHGRPVALLDAAMEPEPFAALVQRYRPAAVLGGEHAPDGYRRAATTAAGPATFARIDSDDPVVSDELALLLPTSGSTGSPKFVRLSRGAVFANATSIGAALGIGAADRAITSLPLHYSYGLSVVNSHLCCGGQLVLTGRNLLEEGFWDLARDHAVTSMAGVPYSYQLLRRLDLDRLNVPALRTMTQAGGRLDVKLAAHFHQVMTARDGRLFIMYGQTEATARITICPADALAAKLGSVGQAIPDGVLEVLGNDGTVCAAGEPGEIAYVGPNVMLGYAEGADDLALGDVQGGRLATGDIGYLDEEGFLFITGRLKRIAKAFGYRLNLDEIEAALAGRGAVAAIAVDDRVVVYCERWEPTAITEALAHVARLTHVHPSAFQFKVIEHLPVLPNGKIDYRALGQA